MSEGVSLLQHLPLPVKAPPTFRAAAASPGPASAQVALGQFHFFGARGIAHSYAEALRWYEKAVEQGDGNAMGHLPHLSY